MDLTEYWNILRDWRTQAANAGHPVPSLDDLYKIANAGTDDWPTDLDWSSVGPWRRTIEQIRDQKRMGVRDPVSQMPDELLLPQPSASTVRHRAAGPASASPTGTGGTPWNHATPGAVPPPGVSPGTSDVALGVLHAWRDKAIAEGRPGIESLQEATIAKVARDFVAGRPAEAIINLLPKEQRSFGEPMVAALSSVGLRAPGGPVPAPAPAAADAVNGAANPVDAPGKSPRHGTAADQDSPPVRADNGASPAGSGVGAHSDTDEGTPAAETDIDPRGFASLTFNEPIGEPGDLTAESAGDIGWNLSWPATDRAAGTAIYRVVINDHEEPFSPEDGELISATTALGCTVDKPFETALRYLQVWCNVGADEATAKRAQPRIIAQTVLVAPVQDVVIREEQGVVIGQWRALPGTQEVQVYRKPINRGFSANRPGDQILAGENLMNGFVDSEAERGKRFVYQIYAVASVDGVVRLSMAVNQPISVSAQLSRVMDLQVEVRTSAGNDVFDVSWTQPPAGYVVVYRTQTGPLPGVEQSILGASALEQAKLSEPDKLAHPINQVTPDRSGMREVPWPGDWNRAYFTPVTLLGEQAVVGKTITATRSKGIDDAAIVERVNRQILTFSWPAGASLVSVYMGPTGGDAEQARQGQSVEVNRQTWEHDGGLLFPYVLPDDGRRLHLVPVAFNAGRRVEGKPASVDYPWLLRIRYQLQIKRNILKKPTAAIFSLSTQRDVGSPRFVLVHNQHRLPLDYGDGTPLPVWIDGDPNSTPSPRVNMQRLSPETDAVKWRADVTGHSGFIRLFVDLPPEMLKHVALLDPKVTNLFLGYGS